MRIKNRWLYVLAVAGILCGGCEKEEEKVVEYPLGQGVWEHVGIFPLAYPDGVVEVVCDSMYFTGLRDMLVIESDEGDESRSWFSYKRGWSDFMECAPFPGRSRKGAVAFTLFGRIYVGLGVALDRKPFEIGAQYLSDFWWYDPWEDTWDSVPAPFPGGGRTGAVAFVAGEKAYVGTGYMSADFAENKYCGDFYEFTPVGGWRRVESMDVNPRENAAVISSGEAHYLCFGTELEAYRDCWRFVPETLTWERREPLRPKDFPVMPEKVRTFTLHADGRDYAYAYEMGTDLCFVFDFETERWQQAEGVNLGDYRCFAIGDRLYGSKEYNLYEYKRE